jgi:hypothetical protein
MDFDNSVRGRGTSMGTTVKRFGAIWSADQRDKKNRRDDLRYSPTLIDKTFMVSLLAQRSIAGSKTTAHVFRPLCG